MVLWFHRPWSYFLTDFRVPPLVVLLPFFLHSPLLSLLMTLGLEPSDMYAVLHVQIFLSIIEYLESPLLSLGLLCDDISAMVLELRIMNWVVLITYKGTSSFSLLWVSTFLFSKSESEKVDYYDTGKNQWPIP